MTRAFQYYNYYDTFFVNFQSMLVSLIHYYIYEVLTSTKLIVIWMEGPSCVNHSILWKDICTRIQNVSPPTIV